nr:immunoglobulin light chain junction region [Macaca mulatta]MOV34029.1 immunoglobulin light chain junction region [Macaca mulatta]MOV34033.1 immunoglobulin light chain junction region [Macaca mulatta]MOV34034.1 immunoglobulin light chain junction region [Macaca mulatta]MOV34048.1 immunoglobulin light chain junction region [Macaca mulatta]
CMQGLEFPLTF